MNTFMHGPSFFSFHFLSFFISFPKLTIFTILRLYMACKMWKITAHTWEISSWRLVEKFHISPFPCIILYIIGLEKYLLRIQKKKTQKQAQKDMNEMEWHKMDYLIFSAVHMRKRQLF